MKNGVTLSDLGEVKTIQIIDDLIFEKTGKRLIRDDAFYFELARANLTQDKTQEYLILKTDTLVSTTDAPEQMNYYQIGRKSIIINISDVFVKGIVPKGVIISLGLPKNMELCNFKELIEGIVDCCAKYNIDYIGGDLAETKEIVITPTIFGFQKISLVIHRTGIKVGDYIATNAKFGLTGAGFDILLHKKSSLKQYPGYKRSIMAVLEPEISEKEAFALAEHNFATASIDSSDGLAKSLTDLMLSNPTIGFEIEFSDDLIDPEAKNYAEKFNLNLNNLVFNAGEEFIHIFTIDPKNYDLARKIVQKAGGKLFKIGQIVPEKGVYVITNGKKTELRKSGYEHFSK